MMGTLIYTCCLITCPQSDIMYTNFTLMQLYTYSQHHYQAQLEQNWKWDINYFVKNPDFIHSFIHSSSTHLQSIGQVKFWLMMSENRCSVPYPVQNSKRHCGLKRKCPIGWESANQSSNTNIFSFYLSHCKQSLHAHFCGSCVTENWFCLPHESLLGASNYIKHLKV